MSSTQKLTPLSCLIVSQNTHLSHHISLICQELPHLTIQAICEQGEKISYELIDKKTDLILWDKATVTQQSIDFLKNIDVLPQIIVLTNATDTTIDLPDYFVTTEIPYPFEPQQFTDALSLVAEIQEEKEALRTQKITQTSELRRPKTVLPDYLFLKTEGRINRFLLDEILYFEGHGEFVILKTTRGNFKLNTNMKKLGSKLLHPVFLKTHRAFIVNTSKISHIEENEMFINGERILISRAHRNKVWDELDIF